tara:strand:- start:1331 stop:2437 length:1107 start_codon:yes stop_codon:yes gene_type:complete
MGSEARARLHRLDHLRAVAALLVGFWHFLAVYPAKLPENAGFLGVLAEGWTGVSLFCVISGFILYYIYSDQNYKYSEFIIRRFLRVAPLFLLLIYVTFLVTDWPATNLLTSVVAGLFRGGFPSIGGPAWTVVIEFQFYLLFPFLLHFSLARGPKYLAALIALFVALRTSIWFEFGSIEQAAYYSILGRADQFLAGMLAASLLRRDLGWRLMNSAKIAPLGLCIFTILLILYFWWLHAAGGLMAFGGHAFPSPSPVWAIHPTIEAFLYSGILLFYLHLPLFRMRIASQTLSLIGLVSYSFYLIHAILMKNLEDIFLQFGYTLTNFWVIALIYAAVVVPLIVAASWVTYSLIEKPFMDMRRSKETTRSHG